METIKDILPKALPDNERMKNLLTEGGPEFNKECAYWLISCKDLAPLRLPTRPEELLEYDRWSPNEKKNTSEKFWRQERVYAYLNQKQYTIDRNKGMLDKLIEFKSYIPEGDITTLAKFDRYIMLYNQEKQYPENWQDRGDL